MAGPQTTTIRVPIQTRDRLRVLAERRGESAGELVTQLVGAADEEAMLVEMAAGFERLAGHPEALSAYRAEAREVESAFEARTPEW